MEVDISTSIYILNPKVQVEENKVYYHTHRFGHIQRKKHNIKKRVKII
jgi:hypothetical protein